MLTERSPGNTGGQPAANVSNDDPQPPEAATLSAQHGGHPTGSPDSSARDQGPSATAAPASAL
eukprot:1071248-Pyramimonas_sp.AAC.1